MTAPLDLRERKRRVVRAELSEVALQLLTDRDFESVTIDEMAAAAGVSRRTFFRYFTSKADVVFAFLDRWASRLAEDIVAFPDEDDHLGAVLHSFQRLSAAYEGRALALVRLVRETPSLRAEEHIHREHLRLSVVQALARRLGVDPANDMRPHVLASVAFAPLDAAMVSWFGGSSGEDIGSLLEKAVATFWRELDALCARQAEAAQPPDA